MPGAHLFLQAPQDLRIGGRNTATEYQYTLTGDNLKELNDLGAEAGTAAMDKLPQIKDVAYGPAGQQGSARAGGDRPRDGEPVGGLAAGHRLDAFGRVWADAGFDDVHAAESVPRGDGGCAAVPGRDPDALKNIYVKSTTGAMVPLSAVTHFETQRIPSGGESPVAVAGYDVVVQPGAGGFAEPGDAGDSSRLVVDIGMPSAIHGGFAGVARRHSRIR